MKITNEVLTGLRAIGVKSATFGTTGGIKSVEFHEASQAEREAQLVSEWSDHERSQFLKLDDDSRTKYLQQQRDDALFRSS